MKLLSRFSCFFALSIIIYSRAAAQCAPAGGVPTVACGTGTALTNGVTITTGTFNATGGSFSGVILSGGTLVLCGTVTMTNFTINSGNLVINAGGNVTFSGTFNTNGGSSFNSGTTTYNQNITMQGTNPVRYIAPGATITVNGTLMLNAGTVYNNGTTNAQSVTVNSGGAICMGPGGILNVTNFMNNQANSVSIPSGSACLHYTGSYSANNPAISAGAKFFVCQAAGASAPTGNLGAATLVTNCSSCQTVLPVTLVSFTGTRNGNTVQLQWATAQEENMSSFAIQLSTDGQNFQTIGTVPARNQPSTYTYSTTIAANSYFRLQIIDIDGKFTYSPIVFVELPAAGFNLSIQSNPVRESYISITVHTTANQNGQLTVLDNAGRSLRKLSMTLNTGTNNVRLSLEGLSPGYYYLRFNGSSGDTKTLPFIYL